MRVTDHDVCTQQHTCWHSRSKVVAGVPVPEHSICNPAGGAGYSSEADVIGRNGLLSVSICAAASAVGQLVTVAPTEGHDCASTGGKRHTVTAQAKSTSGCTKLHLVMGCAALPIPGS